MLLGSEVAFVRSMLLEEMAKGIDGAWRLALDQALASTRASLLDILGVSPPAPGFADAPVCGVMCGLFSVNLRQAPAGQPLLCCQPPAAARHSDWSTHVCWVQARATGLPRS